METKSQKRNTKYSVQLKFVASFTVIILGLIVLLNTYPIIVLRDTVFTSKHSSLQSQATVMSSSLSRLESLSPEYVTTVMGVLDIMPTLNRVIITDEAGKILYDTSDVDSKVGKYALFSEIYHSLSGDMVFYSQYQDGAFMSRVSMPVSNRGNIIGAVYLYEYDSEQGQIIQAIQRYLRNISVIIFCFSLVLIFFFTRALTQRIMDLVRTIRIVRDGEYEYRMRVKGSDELSELANELNNLTARLQDTEEVRRRFVSDASHELKTPLASIRLLSESILQTPDMDEDMLLEFVGDIGSEAERLQRTTDKLLNLTRLDADHSVSRQSVDVKAVAENTIRLLKPLAEKNDISLSTNLSEGCFIYAAPDDIYQVVFNLVENAIKYNLPGGEVKLLLFVSEGHVNLYVDDTGIGIPEEDAPRIFSRFYRVDKARSRDAGGSGLGLSIVHDAVTLHGGEISVEPGNERGTRFKVSFPVYSETRGVIPS